MPDAPAPGSLRIALLSPSFWPEVRRGSERFIRDLADGLLARGHRPRLITSHPGPPRRGVEDGLAILRLPRPPHGPPLRRMLEPHVSHVPLSYAALRARDYDVAHAVYPPDALAAAVWRRRTGRPAVLSYMGIPDLEWLAQRNRLQVLRAGLRGCSATVALSRHAAEVFERALGYRAPVISPGVRLDTFAPGPVRAGEPTIICAAAAADPRKHVGLLVASFQRLRAQHPRARLVLSRPRDLAAARRAGVPVQAPGLEWADLDDRDALARAYASAWVSALPAPSEAFGLVLAEALACGTPVVGFHDGGIPEIIDRPDIGRTFRRLDTDALATALTQALALSQDPATAARCRARAEDLSAETCTERYLALYRGLGAV